MDETQTKSIISEVGGASPLEEAEQIDPKEEITDIPEKEEPIVYDYMKYANTKKKGRSLYGCRKAKKNVSFKAMVELVTFTEDWKMQTTHSDLRNEDQQRNCKIVRRNF